MNDLTNLFRTFWVSDDGQAELHLGDGATEEASLADAIQTVKKEGIATIAGRLVTVKAGDQ